MSLLQWIATIVGAVVIYGVFMLGILAILKAASDADDAVEAHYAQMTLTREEPTDE